MVKSSEADKVIDCSKSNYTMRLRPMIWASIASNIKVVVGKTASETRRESIIYSEKHKRSR